MAEPLRLLVVEDSESDTRLLLRELERAGYDVSWERVETAGSMRSALEGRSWDLVVADYTMPSFSAPAALALLQESGIDLPFIIVSGSVGEDIAVEAMRAGAHDYLLKGNLKRLLPAVQRELEQAGQRRARRKAEEQYRFLFENGPYPMWIVDRETLRFLAVNDAAVKHYGYTREEFLAMRVTDIRQLEELPAFMEVSRGIAAGVERAIRKHHKKDGSFIYVEATTHPLTFDERSTWLTLAYDVTDRLRAEEFVQKLLLAVEQTENVIFMTDSDGAITYVNPAFETVYGFPRGEVLGKTPRILKSGRYDQSFYKRFWQKLLAGESVRGEVVNKRHDGQLVTVVESVNPFLNAEGRRIGFIAVQNDITQRRLLEEQFRQAQKMEAVGQLAGGVAHDFNNLLTAILGYADLLTTQAGQGSPLSESIGEIRKAGERAASLTQQLLAFSRRQVLLPEVLDLNGITTEMENMLRRLIGEDVELITSCAPSLGRMKADRGQIEQVLMNLVVNARDAMPKGGKLTLETSNVELDENYTRDHAAVQPGPYVLLAVSDTGVGMDADTLSHMFEPFFTTKEKGKGTGLGLATVYGIVKQSGGHIWVYSEPGRGTTFKVYLPRVEEAVPTAPPRSSDSLPTLGTETILLVEDEEAVRRLVRMVLEGKGYTVLEASGWQEALEIAGQQKPIQLVITDVVMPGVGGPELISRLEAVRPGIRVLFMSGYTDGAIVNNGLLSSTTAFLQKPFTPDVLLRKVREVLSS
jgi:two-component system cell cycle sensor histidine kinase/response regulator CckA